MADEPPPLGSVRPLADHGHPWQHPHPPRGPYAAQAAEADGHHAPPADMASVMGIPEEQMTEPVRAAVARLMAEVARLREEIGRRDMRIEDAAYHHSAVPTLNRRGVKRELSRIIHHMDQGGLGAVLAFLRVQGIDRLRQCHGLAAADAAQLHVADRLLSGLRQSDAVGLLGQGDFVLLLALTEPAAAAAKLRELAQRVNDPAFGWEGRRFHFDIALGLAALAPGMTPDEALAAADRALLGSPLRV